MINVKYVFGFNGSNYVPVGHTHINYRIMFYNKLLTLMQKPRFMVNRNETEVPKKHDILSVVLGGLSTEMFPVSRP